MTDQPEHETKQIQPQHSTEAPCSANVKARIGGYDWQITCRSHVDQDDLINMAKAIKWWNAWLDKTAAPSTNAAMNAINVEAPAVSASVVTPSAAPTAPTAPANGNGKHEAHCAMIEIGTSYQGNKTQLKFYCDGYEHPLTYTRSISDMIKLLQPIGQYTADHLQNGKKYSANCFVIYHESDKDGKTYKNVDAVRAA